MLIITHTDRGSSLSLPLFEDRYFRVNIASRISPSFKGISLSLSLVLRDVRPEGMHGCTATADDEIGFGIENYVFLLYKNF